jgi:predicted flap endonuclease-1-like 5' DNA nuclease/pimeloyl-ACP methyl ester carboxylesterase
MNMESRADPGFNLLGALFERYLQNVEAFAHVFTDQRKASRSVSDVAWNHVDRLRREAVGFADNVQTNVEREMGKMRTRASIGPANWLTDWLSYATDAAQRQVLMLDTLRQRGNNYVEHLDAGMPPVLDFEYEVLIDGRELESPVNYSLVRVVPPQGVSVDDCKQPFMIIDPRAGHGAGIGGFKPDSQVGEAFKDGHPVYFVVFRPVPEPGQTMADVRDAEVEFLREIVRRHPQAPHPAVIGNCQGGWAAMLLAASAPEFAGPVVINGAPMSFWAGRTGENPMRYLGGLSGGALPALMLSDIGQGVFDGAWLVLNFESLDPANHLFKKYYHLYSNIDTESARYLGFERWWGGFYLMNEPEIRWIVENLFVGNRLARGEARLGGETIDLRRITSPIIVFASHGDNITPPQQALNWIADLYANVDEIKMRGQRIVYMLHETIGHLGIFVSSKIANREHDAITDTLRAIDALPPGLYEMKLVDAEDRVHIRFEARTIDDILGIDDGREDEELFASVARLSELATEVYDIAVRPWVRATVTQEAAQATRDLQPIRLRRSTFSDLNPFMGTVGAWAEEARGQRQPVDVDNPFAAMERVWASMVESQLNLYRDVRDAWLETLFHSIYSTPAVKGIGRHELQGVKHRHGKDLRMLPEVHEALEAMTEGGAAEGAVRMLALMSKARGYMRRSRMERLIELVTTAGTLGKLDEAALSKLVKQQQIVVDLEPEQALATLPLLLETEDERRTALAAVAEVSGPAETMHPAALVLMLRFQKMLGLHETFAPPQVATAVFASAADIEGATLAATDHALDPAAVHTALSADSTLVPRAPHIEQRDDATPDDLERLTGVGPRMAEKLHQLGFQRYAQLAALQPEEEAWLDLKLNARGRVMREAWVAQARARLNGTATE